MLEDSFFFLLILNIDVSGGWTTILPGGSAVPGRVPAGIPTINLVNNATSPSWHHIEESDIDQWIG